MANTLLNVMLHMLFKTVSINNFRVFQVKHISEDPPCKCPNKFCVERLSQGRYRVGEKILFIRVKILFFIL